MGSPPQVRGKLGMAGFGIDTSRITPAGAGKTVPAAAVPDRREDHPRRCGENLIIPPFPILSTGSPPQVRGKQPPSAKSIDKHRITPAGAGKTYLLDTLYNLPMDHPRRCGENSHIHAAASFMPGSPPQVRGKQFASPHLIFLPGITPAGAGKTQSLPGKRLLT